MTCPEGKTSTLWKPGQDRWGNEVIHTEFARRECLACASRPRCTRAKSEGREMTLRPRERRAAGERHLSGAVAAEYQGDHDPQHAIGDLALSTNTQHVTRSRRDALFRVPYVFRVPNDSPSLL